MITAAFAAVPPHPTACIRAPERADDVRVTTSFTHEEASLGSFTPSTSPTSTQQAIYALNVGGEHIDVASELLACLPQGNLLRAAIVEGPRMSTQPGTEPRVFVPRSPTTFRLVVDYYSNDRKLPRGLPDHELSKLKMEASHFALVDLHAECKVFYPLRRRARLAKVAGATQVRANALQSLAWNLRQHGLMGEAQRKQLRAAQLSRELSATRGATSSRVEPQPSHLLEAPRTPSCSPTRRPLMRTGSRDVNTAAYRRASMGPPGVAPATRGQRPSFTMPLAIPQRTAPAYDGSAATSWPPMPSRAIAPGYVPSLGLYTEAPALPSARVSAPLLPPVDLRATQMNWSQPAQTPCTAACAPACPLRAPLDFFGDDTATPTGVMPSLISPVSYGTLSLATESSPAYLSVAPPYLLPTAPPMSTGMQPATPWQAGVLATSAPAALGSAVHPFAQRYAGWPPAPQTLEDQVADDVVLPDGMVLEVLTATSGNELTDGAPPSWEQTDARVRSWRAAIPAQDPLGQTLAPALMDGPADGDAFSAPLSPPVAPTTLQQLFEPLGAGRSSH